MKNNINWPCSINIGNFPTRIVNQKKLSKELGVNLFIKNEYEADVIGSGNKVRKLKYLLKKIVDENYNDVILDGTIDSNCGVAVSHYAPIFNLKVNLILIGKPTFEGNHLKMILSGSNIIYQSKWNPIKIKETTQKIFNYNARKNRKSFVIPTGATNELTVFGSIELGYEISKQEKKLGQKFDFIIVPIGTGGTFIGLEIAKSLLNKKGKIIGISIANNKDYFNKIFFNICKKIVRLYKVDKKILKIRPCIYDGALGEGYHIFSKRDVYEINRLRKKYGIIFDTTYTYKAFKGLKDLISNKTIKKNSKVLFIHTGGMNQIFSTKRKFLRRK